MDSTPVNNSEILPKSGTEDRGRQLAQSDWKLIEQWVILGSSFGIPKSVSRIYGLMFVSSDPLSAKDCVDTLKISRSSAGQGIRFLVDMGAIKPVLEIGKREESYVVEPDLGVLVKNLLQGRFFPSAYQFLEGLSEIHGLAERENNEHIKMRLEKLSRWKTKMTPFKYWIERQF